MDPQLMMMLLAQQGGAPQGHPLSRAFGGVPMYGSATIQPSQMYDLSGIGLGPSSGPFGMMAGMVMQSQLPQFMGPNFTPGQFTPTQNLFDHKYAVQHYLNQRKAIERATQADQETYFRMIRGGARMMGIEAAPGSAQERQFQRFASDFSGIAPIIGDLAPDTFDQLHGVRGSAGQFARNSFNASRFTFDPASGRLGMSGESAGAIANETFNMLYGPGADITRMRGLGAGRAGQIYEEMIKRGFAPSVAMNQREAVSRLGGELSRSPSEIASPELRRLRKDLGQRYGVGDDEAGSDAFKKISSALEDMGKTDPAALGTALRSFNASRVAKSIETMAGAVSAMRDIFGDMGRPNAPMTELINGLQALTQGGLSHMTPGQIERSVRQTYAIAKYTGIGLEGIMGFAGTASQVLDQQGMSRALAPGIAQNSAAYGFAFGLAGQPTQFGAVDREMASQLDLRLRAQASSSPQAVRLAAVMRYADTLQRRDKSGEQVTGFDKGTEAYAISEAIRSGRTEYSFGGRNMSIFQAAPRITEILAQAGVNRNDIQQAITRNPGAAGRLIERYGIQDLVREGQGDLDGRNSFGSVFASSATSYLARSGIPRDKQGQIASAIGPALFDVTRSMLENSPEMFNAGNEANRNKAIAKELRGKLGKQLDGISDADLANLVDGGLESAEDFTQNKGSGYSGFGSFLGYLQLNNRRTAQLQRRTVSETKSITKLQSALSGLGQEGVVSRISEYLQNVGPGGGSLKELAIKALGGIDNKAVSGPLAEVFKKVSSLQAEYDDLGTRYLNDPERRKIEEERILEEIKRFGPEISKLLEAGGASTDGVGYVNPHAQTVPGGDAGYANPHALGQRAGPAGQASAAVGAGARATGTGGSNRDVNLAANNVNIGEVPRVELNAREVNFNGMNADMKANFISADDDEEAVEKTQTIVGRLTLVGFDTAEIEASTTPQDARSQI